jgi:hypothetical protein
MSPDFGLFVPKDIGPGFGGMLHSRRQGHASFASVTGAG